MDCKICSGSTSPVGEKWGKYHGRAFRLRHCEKCRFSFVEDPWLEFEKIYCREYYEGRGADPLVDYIGELNEPQSSIRQYEWRGILDAVRAIAPSLSLSTRWLDYGCGSGGLVRYVREKKAAQIFGYETGGMVAEMVERGIPLLSDEELENSRNSFDVVTMIEVIEHVLDPIAELKRVRSLLKPGGILFLTTGNAEPFRQKLLEWQYITPEIHISFFEPETLSQAMRQAGFEPLAHPWGKGFRDIVRFKILKNLGFRKMAVLEKVLPWGLLSWAANRVYRISAHPYGVARG